MSKTKKLPTRSQVKSADRWDLESLYHNDETWETAFGKWEGQIGKYAKFRGTLSDSPAALAKCLKFDSQFDRVGERLGTYAHLKTAEDMADSCYQRMQGRYTHAATNAAEASSFIRPEILEMPATRLKKFLAAKELGPYRLQLERLVRYKPHTLSRGEEKLLAMQSEMAHAADKMFRQLTDADLNYYAEQFERSGFRGGLNRYRNQERDWQRLTGLTGARITRPACFIAGGRDKVLRFVPNVDLVENMKRWIDDLRVCEIINGAGHWIQQERPAQVNRLLTEFLRGLNP